MAVDSAWNHERSLKLIHLYEEHEHLWKVFIPEYKNKELREQSIQKIAVEMNEKPEVIRRKIANLRAQYHHELRKVNSANNGGIYDGKWFAFESLDFLRDVVNSQHVSNSSSWDNEQDSLPIFDDPHLLNRNSNFSTDGTATTPTPFKISPNGDSSQQLPNPFACLNEFNFISPSMGLESQIVASAAAAAASATGITTNGENGVSRNNSSSIVNQSDANNTINGQEETQTRRRMRTETSTHYEMSHKIMKLEPSKNLHHHHHHEPLAALHQLPPQPPPPPPPTSARYDEFGKHVAAYLRGMTERQADLAILKISELIYNTKYAETD